MRKGLVLKLFPGTTGDRTVYRRSMALGTSAEEFATRIGQAYAAEGKALDLGRPILQGQTLPDVPVQVPVAMCNRHGLIAGATSAFGPQLLSKVIGANETQASSLTLVFRYADDNGRALLDRDDLREVLKFLSSPSSSSSSTRPICSSRMPATPSSTRWRRPSV
jgi:hypothetical protein